MSDIYLTSDWHFWHLKNFLYVPRGFQTVEEMNEAIIERHNSLVKDDDIVYVLGDCVLSDTDRGVECIKRLKGRKFLAFGNHCTDSKIERFKQENLFEDIQYGYRLKVGKYHFHLVHYPVLAGAVYNQADKTYGLCGHSHTKDKFVDWAIKCYHVEQDAHNCYPVPLEQIKDEIRQRREDEHNGCLET